MVIYFFMYLIQKDNVAILSVTLIKVVCLMCHRHLRLFTATIAAMIGRILIFLGNHCADDSVSSTTENLSGLHLPPAPYWPPSRPPAATAAPRRRRGRRSGTSTPSWGPPSTSTSACQSGRRSARCWPSGEGCFVVTQPFYSVLSVQAKILELRFTVKSE